jgi:hypothetical protein
MKRLGRDLDARACRVFVRPGRSAPSEVLRLSWARPPLHEGFLEGIYNLQASLLFYTLRWRLTTGSHCVPALSSAVALDRVRVHDTLNRHFKKPERHHPNREHLFPIFSTGLPFFYPWTDSLSTSQPALSFYDDLSAFGWSSSIPIPGMKADVPFVGRCRKLLATLITHL